MTTPLFVEIVFPLNVDQAFTYKVPESLCDAVQVGQRVIAPLGRRNQQGMVIYINTAPPKSYGGKVKDLINIVDPVPIFDTGLIKLLKWISRYYFTPLGKVIQSAIPSDARLKKEVLVQASDRLIDEDDLSTYIKEQGLIRLSSLKRRFGSARAVAEVARLQRKGMVDLENDFAFRGRKSSDWKVIPNLGVNVELPSRAHAQQRTFDLLCDYPEGLSRKELTEDYNISFEVVRKLEQRGFVTLHELTPDIDPLKDYHRPPEKRIILNQEQQRAFEEIQRSLDERVFTPYMLFGVAGSGKTEVYLNAAGHALSMGRSVIVLVPEIALAPQIAHRFQSRFGAGVALWHSNLRGPERLWTWQQIQKGRFQVVVGARSAILTPIRNLGLIIVDEEQENSYKQEEHEPRYHARDVALVRGREEHAVVILGSATPSLESYFNLNQGRYRGLHLTKRWEKAQTPFVELVDMAREREESKDYHNPFSRRLLEGIRETLDNKHQVILFQNRRGYAPIIRCRDCNWIMECPHDGQSLTYHKIGNKMSCHYCDFQAPPPRTCPACKSSELVMGGMGTQKIEEALAEYFPEAAVVRMDTDTTRGKGAHQKILGDFARGHYDILLGTQMIAKGLDFEKVTLVGVINADAGLHFPDFRAREKTFQLVYQVSGRSGRGKYPGKVIIQSWSPDDFAIQCATHHDVKLFYNKELNDRFQLNYPPFSRMVAFSFHGRSRDEVIQAAEQMAGLLRSNKTVELLGPAPALIEKSRMGYHWKLILKSSKEKDPTGARLRQAAVHIIQRMNASKVRLKVDADPAQIL